MPHLLPQISLNWLKMKESYFRNSLFFCTPAGARTLDTLIKSQVLYQLSYGCNILLFKTALFLFCGCKGKEYF